MLVPCGKLERNKVKKPRRLKDNARTDTNLVNTSPTYIKKKVGDTNGAKKTCRIAIHIDLLIFHGNIKHFMV